MRGCFVGMDAWTASRESDVGDGWCEVRVVVRHEGQVAASGGVGDMYFSSLGVEMQRTPLPFCPASAQRLHSSGSGGARCGMGYDDEVDRACLQMFAKDWLGDISVGGALSCVLLPCMLETGQ